MPLKFDGGNSNDEGDKDKKEDMKRGSVLT